MTPKSGSATAASILRSLTRAGKLRSWLDKAKMNSLFRTKANEEKSTITATKIQALVKALHTLASGKPAKDDLRVITHH